MGSHDDYGKKVLLLATNGAVDLDGSPIEVDFGAGFPARIDGAVGRKIAIEVESRTSKQVRGAVLDLICHSYPKKLLILLPVHMSNPEITAKQSEKIFGRFLPPDAFRVLLLRGSGDAPAMDHDIVLVAEALAQLGYDKLHRPLFPKNIRNLEERNEKFNISSHTKQSTGKYQALANHLRKLAPSETDLSLTFEQIENIIGFPLPDSAFKYREWWSNQSDTSNRPQARAWINSGFRVDNVHQDRKNGRVRFIRY